MNFDIILAVGVDAFLIQFFIYALYDSYKQNNREAAESQMATTNPRRPEISVIAELEEEEAISAPRVKSVSSVEADVDGPDKGDKHLSLSDFHIIGYRAMGFLPENIPFISDLIRTSLKKAGIKINSSVYIRSMFFWTLVASVLAFASSLYTGYTLSFILPIALIPGPINLGNPALSVLMGITSGIGVTTLFNYYPNYVAGIRKRRIEKNLVYVSNYMSIMSNAGTTPEETFASLAENGEVYGIKDSARSIMRDLEFFGKDIISAIEEESRNSPSEDFSDFLQGFVATIRVGGDVKSYLAFMTEKFMAKRRSLLLKIISNLNLAAEIYTVVIVAFPIILIVLFVIMGFFGGTIFGSLEPLQVMSVLTYILVPGSVVGLLVMLDSLLVKW